MDATYDAYRGYLGENGNEIVYRSSEYIVSPRLADMSGLQGHPHPHKLCATAPKNRRDGVRKHPRRS